VTGGRLSPPPGDHREPPGDGDVVASGAVDVVVVGSLNLDLVVRAPRLPQPGETLLGTGSATAAGGKGLNQAVAAARQGAVTAMIGMVGDDAYGAELLGLAATEGIDARGIGRAHGDGTGVAHITVDDAGTNCIVVVPRSNRRVDAAHVRAHASLLRAARVVLVQLEVPLDGVAEALSIARDAGVTTILNPAPARPLADEVLRRCDLLVPNETEAAALTGLDTASEAGARTAARRLTERTGSTVVVTLGHRGAVYCDGHGVHDSVRPFPVATRDTTAAGDAFCGTLAAALAAGLPLEAALRRASAAGALAATAPGAVPSLPTSAAVDLLLGDPAGPDQ
jgi:ribokinase